MGLPAKNDFFLEGLLLCCNPQKINAARSIERDCFLGMGYGNLKDGLAEHINYFQGLCIGWQVFDPDMQKFLIAAATSAVSPVGNP